MKTPKRQFAMTFDALLEKSRTLLRIGRRDAEVLEQYGITPEFLDDFAEQSNAFQKMFRDKDNREITVEITAEKKRFRREITRELRYFGLAFGKTFGKESVFYQRMQIRELGRLKDDTVLGIALMTALRAEKNLAALSAEGVVTERIAALRTKAQEFIAALNAIEAAEDARTEATRMRIAAANNVYRAAMKICRAGWREFDGNPAVRVNYRMK